MIKNRVSGKDSELFMPDLKSSLYVPPVNSPCALGTVVGQQAGPLVRERGKKRKENGTK